ncbi:MAG: type II toxin-antitoxin system RelE/ParE family toxin [Lentisphaerae bacterium]|nr:type II toxin-antitoxin system RelE/ParE family toxin [Lentisphaerota bacterium]
MSFKLKIKESAQKEWEKLDNTIRNQFKKKLSEVLLNPHVPKNALSSMPNCYKIKLRSAGYRLVYLVRDNELVVLIVAVGKRDKEAVYKNAAHRLKK